MENPRSTLVRSHQDRTATATSRPGRHPASERRSWTAGSRNRPGAAPRPVSVRNPRGRS